MELFLHRRLNYKAVHLSAHLLHTSTEHMQYEIGFTRSASQAGFEEALVT